MFGKTKLRERDGEGFHARTRGGDQRLRSAELVTRTERVEECDVRHSHLELPVVRLPHLLEFLAAG
jgi:hypothetical protein